MTMLLIDCRHFGRMLKYARSGNKMSREDCAKLLKISKQELRQFERGVNIINESVMSRLMLYGLMLLKARHTSYNPDIRK